MTKAALFRVNYPIFRTNHIGLVLVSPFKVRKLFEVFVLPVLPVRVLSKISMLRKMLIATMTLTIRFFLPLVLDSLIGLSKTWSLSPLDRSNGYFSFAFPFVKIFNYVIGTIF